MSQLDDFSYEMVYELRDDLKAAGQIAWSTRIYDTLFGAVGSEILGNLRWELRQLRTSEVAQQLHLDGRLDSMLRALDRILAPYFREP